MEDNRSAGFIIYRQNKQIEYLLLLRSDDDRWEFPKGHINTGEGELQAAKREFFEETGINEMSISQFRHEIEFKNTKGLERKIILFLGKVDRGLVALTSEHKEAVWVVYEEARKMVYFRERQEALDKANSYIKERLN